MKKLLRTATLISIVLVLLTTPVNAITIEEMEDGIYKRCEDNSRYWDFPGGLYVDTSDYVHCILHQLVALRKVFGYYYDRDMGYYRQYGYLIEEIMNKHWNNKYNTANDWWKVLNDLEKEIKVMELFPD